MLALKYDAPMLIGTIYDTAHRVLVRRTEPLKASCNAARALWEGTASSSDMLRICFIHFFTSEDVATEEPLLQLIEEVPTFAVDFHLASVQFARESKDREDELRTENSELQQALCNGPPLRGRCQTCGRTDHARNYHWRPNGWRRCLDTGDQPW